jgi:hypothetical protein
MATAPQCGTWPAFYLWIRHPLLLYLGEAGHGPSSFHSLISFSPLLWLHLPLEQVAYNCEPAANVTGKAIDKDLRDFKKIEIIYYET